MTRGGFHLLPRGGRSSGDKGDQRMFSSGVNSFTACAAA
jgi:hypothetical protein